MEKHLPRRELALFFGLSFLLTWLLLLPPVLAGQGLLQISPHWHALGALGPFLAAVITTKTAAGNAGLKDYFRRFGAYRVGTLGFLFSVFGPYLIFLLSLAIVHLANMPAPDFGLLLAGDRPLVWIFGSLLSAVAYGFGEEAGWRGFALPRLQKGRSALAATSILTVFWALWHIPMFFYRFDFGLVQVIGFFVGLFAGSILLTSVFNSTGGNILMVSLWHMNWNIVNIVALEVSEEAVSLMSSFVMIAAIVILVVFKPENLAPDRKVTAEG